jgi:lysozyme
MDYSASGLKLTEQFESCSLTAYQDIKGVWTQGWGHTFGINAASPPITQQQADDWLLEDVQAACIAVNRYVTVSLTQGQFDAMVDWVFNLGVGNFLSSTMLKLLNAGDFAGAAVEIDKWDHSSGQVIAGLLRRRQSETDEFNGV